MRFLVEGLIMKELKRFNSRKAVKKALKMYVPKIEKTYDGGYNITFPGLVIGCWDNFPHLPGVRKDWSVK